jgi:beta-glucosidase
MCAYNQVNGIYCSEHQELWNDILQTKWGFQGVVMLDCGATNDRVAGIEAGLDLEMPGSHGAHDSEIRQCLKHEHANDSNSLQQALDVSFATFA